MSLSKFEVFSKVKPDKIASAFAIADDDMKAALDKVAGITDQASRSSIRQPLAGLLKIWGYCSLPSGLLGVSKRLPIVAFPFLLLLPSVSLMLDA